MSAHETMRSVCAMMPRIEAHLAAHPAGDASPARVAWVPNQPGEGNSLILMKTLIAMTGITVGWTGQRAAIRDRTRLPDGTPNGLVPVPFTPERIATHAPGLDLLVVDQSVEVDANTEVGRAILAAPCRIIVITQQPPNDDAATLQARIPNHA